MADTKQNKYCAFASLGNESDVEQFFLQPILRDLGYDPNYLQTKANIEYAMIGKGRRKRAYYPDYLAYVGKKKDKAVLVIDAKHPNESALDGVDDAQLYASVLRRKMASPKPDQYCIGCNGHLFIVKHYDSNEVMHEIAFSDFTDDNPSYQKMHHLISRSSLQDSHPSTQRNEDLFEFRSVAPVDLPAIFEACHRAVWKAEKRSPSSAFYEFAKIMFVKIEEDRRVREYLAKHENNHIAAGYVPTKSVRFRTSWIEEMEGTADNPINTILFAGLTASLEAQIAKGEKKRIFEEREGIDLASSTIKDVVEFLQHLDLFAVDEDLNGRLFETFLTATMRGEALGQFFTPRSVVKFMVALARLQATPQHMDRVLDGCCGTGGFLIETMANMVATISANRSLTAHQRERLLKQLRMESLWGIDAGKDPQMARIARLNMLLHKDGGSRIYFADALDKKLKIDKSMPLRARLELEELKSEVVVSKTCFNCVLSNPPFSMTYERKKPNERMILQDYTLSIDEKGRPRASLRSSVMFIERYWDFLADEGQLITVMDESILNTLSAEPFRKYILRNFVIRSIISLPRNSFIKAQGSVKTSVLYLRKKIASDEPQPTIFMAICDNVGHSDSGKERQHLNRLPAILSHFQTFENSGRLAGAPTREAFEVSDLLTVNPTTRIDAHFFDPSYFATMHTLDDLARAKGWKVEKLGRLMKQSRSSLSGGATPRGAIYPDEGVKFIRVQNVRPYRIQWNSDADPCIDLRTHNEALKRSQLKPSDVVLTITGTYGVAAVVPPDFGEANINQHSVKIEVGSQIDPAYLAVFLNSTLCRPQFDRAVTGSTRLALDYTSIRNLRIAYPENISEQRGIANAIMEKLNEASILQQNANDLFRTLPELLDSVSI